MLPITSLSWGVDVSSNNGKVDFKELKRLGCSFVIIRDGLGWGTSIGTDSMLDAHYDAAKESGMSVGFYHYIWELSAAGIDHEAQQTIFNLHDKKCDLFVAADIERPDHTRLSYEVLNQMANRWYDRITNAGYRASIYSMGSLLKGFDWCNLPIDLIPWVANWGSKEPTYIRRNLFLWQSDVAGTTKESTLKVQLPGVQNAIDVNRWCCSL